MLGLVKRPLVVLVLAVLTLLPGTHAVAAQAGNAQTMDRQELRAPLKAEGNLHKGSLSQEDRTAVRQITRAIKQKKASSMYTHCSADDCRTYFDRALSMEVWAALKPVLGDSKAIVATLRSYCKRGSGAASVACIAGAAAAAVIANQFEEANNANACWAYRWYDLAFKPPAFQYSYVTNTSRCQS